MTILPKKKNIQNRMKIIRFQILKSSAPFTGMSKIITITYRFIPIHFSERKFPKELIKMNLIKKQMNNK